jgi:uncharacterized protein YqjF (DUF2071 family)
MASVVRRAFDRHPVAHQSWRDLLFLNQAVAPDVLRARVPPELTIDTFEGMGWVTLIPFAIVASRPAGAPRALSMHFFEVNLRTYVRDRRGEPGIFFFSLEASSLSAVAGARLAYALPYFPASITSRREPGGTSIVYSSRRWGDGPKLDVAWTVGPSIGPAVEGSLDHFLIERYVLFAKRARRVYRSRVRHRPYPLCSASVSRVEESLLGHAGLPPLSPAPAIVQHSPGVDVDLFWRRPA